MAINFGPTTKMYIDGLNLELKGLDKKSKTFEESKALIAAEIEGAQKNLKVEAQEAADADGSA